MGPLSERKSERKREREREIERLFEFDIAERATSLAQPPLSGHDHTNKTPPGAYTQAVDTASVYNYHWQRA